MTDLICIDPNDQVSTAVWETAEDAPVCEPAGEELSATFDETVAWTDMMGGEAAQQEYDRITQPPSETRTANKPEKKTRAALAQKKSGGAGDAMGPLAVIGVGCLAGPKGCIAGALIAAACAVNTEEIGSPLTGSNRQDASVVDTPVVLDGGGKTKRDAAVAKDTGGGKTVKDGSVPPDTGGEGVRDGSVASDIGGETVRDAFVIPDSCGDALIDASIDALSDASADGMRISDGGVIFPVPSPVSPASGVIVSPAQVYFSWEPFAPRGIDHYQLCLTTDEGEIEGMSCPREEIVEEAGRDTRNFTHYLSAVDDTYSTYYWKVRACNAAGTICSDYSPIWSFSTGDLRITENDNPTVVPSSIWSGFEYGMCWEEYNYGIHCGRFEQDGRQIGETQRISSGPSRSSGPSVDWIGAEYGVIWEDQRLIAAGGSNEIYFGRFGAGGTRIGDDIQITLSDGFSSQDPVLVWNGTEHVVIWLDARTGNNGIYLAQIDSNGNRNDMNGDAIIDENDDVRITEAESGASSPAMVQAGDNFGVVWADTRHGVGQYEIYFTIVDAYGNKLREDIRITDNVEYSLYPAVVWTGTEFGVVWADDRDGNREIYFARIDADGNKIGDDVRITDDEGQSQWPGIAWNGSEYLIIWSDSRDDGDFYFTRVSATGVKLVGDLRTTIGAQGDHRGRLVWNGMDYSLAWEDERDGNSELYFTTIMSATPP